MTPIERAAMRSLIAEVKLARQEIRRLKARQAVLEHDAKNFERKRKKVADYNRHLNTRLTELTRKTRSA